MVESRTVNAVVVGSSPTCPANMLGSVVKRSTNSTAVSNNSVYTEVQQEWVKNRHSHPNKVNAPIAHSVERLPCKQEAVGSNPAGGTILFNRSHVSSWTAVFKVASKCVSRGPKHVTPRSFRGKK